jgi:excisionase family DNA binding protein
MTTTKQQGESEALLVNERTAAELLGVAPRTVWALAARGELASVRIGRRKLYSLETLRRFVAERETTAA